MRDLALEPMVVATMLLGLSCSATGSGPSELADITSTVSRTGAYYAHATLDEGRFSLMLPQPLVAGDRVSGWMAVLHEGGEFEGTWARAEPGQPLAGFTLEVGSSGFALLDESVIASVPLDAESLPLRLVDADGRTRAEGALPIAPSASSEASSTDRRLVPHYIPNGGMLSLPGPFDGDRSNTLVRVGDRDCESWAESPRKTLVVGGHWPTGETELLVADAGLERRVPVTVLDVTSRIVVRRGDELVIEAVVNGFGGDPGDEWPSLEIGIWYEGGLQHEQAFDLDPEDAEDGRIVRRAAFTVDESLDIQFSAGIRRDW